MAPSHQIRDPWHRPARDRGTYRMRRRSVGSEPAVPQAPGGATTLETVRSWVEMIGVVAAIAGIVILVVQTNELRRQNAVIIESLDQAYRQDTFDKSLGFDEFVVEHAELYAMVTAGATDPAGQSLRGEPADATLRAQADAVAVHILDFYDYILLGYPVRTYPRLGRVDSGLPGYDPDDAEGFLAWSDAIRDTFQRGSHLCAVYQAKKGSYGARSFVRRIDGARLC